MAKATRSSGGSNSYVNDASQAHIIPGLQEFEVMPLLGGLPLSSVLSPVDAVGTYVPSTGIASADTAALQAAHDAFGVNGGTIVLDSGPYLLTGGGVNFTNPVSLRGTGPSGPNVAVNSMYLNTGTLINCASATGNAITVNADGCSFSNLSFHNTASTTPTAGSAIEVATHGTNTLYYRCDFVGFYINVNIINGMMWSFAKCFVADPVYRGLQIADVTLPDGGDPIIEGCEFVSGPTNATPDSAINWYSGGGPRIIGNKFNCSVGTAFTVAIQFLVADGVNTSVVVIDGNSIENMAYGVYCQLNGTTGQLHKIAITNNEFQTTTNAIAFSPASTGKVGTIVIANNVGNASSHFTYLRNVDLVHVGPNVHTGTAAINFQTGLTNITLTDFRSTTAARPAATYFKAGASYYDTTLSLPGYSDGTVWRNAAGVAI